MNLPSARCLKCEAVCEGHDTLKKEHTFVGSTCSRDFIHIFVHRFFANNIPRRKSAYRVNICAKARLLLDAMFFKGISYDETLDRFCDLIKLDRTAWKVSMYHKATEKPSANEMESDTANRFDAEDGSLRTCHNRWSKRLAGIPAEFYMHDGCFGASKCVYTCFCSPWRAFF